MPNKSFVQLIYIHTHSLLSLETFNSEFLYIEVQFTDQNSKPLVLEREK